MQRSIRAALTVALLLVVATAMPNAINITAPQGSYDGQHQMAISPDALACAYISHSGVLMVRKALDYTQWSEPVALSHNLPGGAVSHHAIEYGGQRFILVWIQGTVMYKSVSSDGGTWSTPQVVLSYVLSDSMSELCLAAAKSTNSCAQTPTHHWVLAYEQNYNVYVIESFSNGDTWTTPVVVRQRNNDNWFYPSSLVCDWQQNWILAGVSAFRPDPVQYPGRIFENILLCTRQSLGMWSDVGVSNPETLETGVRWAPDPSVSG